ncbi:MULTISPECIES: hypothetical protein [unclassified Clostridium]|uniref:hypothetical protein n=1 Tax=unclassified Clostridium TaxID=2614128 RepID=UPI0002985AEA|nr:MULTISPECIES: hypothetical protein [unclassified Clostridium]EKQ57437.1 MAG: hypothetical protein A370_00917 [Clostridium sp. Maddingley MBC34-26]
MDKLNLKTERNNMELRLTIVIAILIIVCSTTGISYQKLYSKETVDWLAQTIGQDISNLIFICPILLISAFYASKRNKAAQIIWIGTMLTNVYSYVIYCFAVHFNFLFHVYCVILGLSIYSVINFFIKNINVNFKSWFSKSAPVKTIGVFLFAIALIFTFLWLSNSVPAVIKNTVPEDITKDALLTNPVQALDFSFYLPLMFISSFKVLKRKNEGYFLAPMMMVFAVLTNVNIICLMIVSMQKEGINTITQIIIFSIFSIICLVILCKFLKNILKD